MPSDHRQIEATFELTLPELLAAHRFLLLRSGTGKLAFLLYAFLLLGAIGRGSAPVIAAVIGLTAVMFSWLLYFHPRRAFLSSPNLHGRQLWVLGPSELCIEARATDGSALGKTELSWRSLAQIHESPRAFLLSASRRVFFVLPKSALGEDEIAAARELFAARPS